MGVVIFNGNSSKDFGIEVEHFPNYQFARRNYTLTKIAGRSGDVVDDDESYMNIDREYNFAFAVREDETFADAAMRFSRWLSTTGGYKRLWDSYEPLVYREALLNEAGNIENIQNGGGRATVKFSCKPYRWLLSGEDPITIPSGSATTIENPTAYIAHPQILITSVGSGTVTVNNMDIDITGYIGQMIVDCEMQNTYYGTSNLNEFTDIPEFPVLVPGDNVISWTGQFSSVQVVPRWWVK